jgi:hypothetical protein
MLFQMEGHHFGCRGSSDSAGGLEWPDVPLCLAGRSRSPMLPARMEQFLGAGPLASRAGEPGGHLGLRHVADEAFTLKQQHPLAEGRARMRLLSEPGRRSEGALIARPMPRLDREGAAGVSGSARTPEGRITAWPGFISRKGPRDSMIVGGIMHETMAHRRLRPSLPIVPEPGRRSKPSEVS